MAQWEEIVSITDNNFRTKIMLIEQKYTTKLNIIHILFEFFIYFFHNIFC